VAVGSIPEDATMPAPILAERLGIHPARAAQRTRLAGSTYADYLAAHRRNDQQH
jgi:hypothetical protein